MVLRMFGAVVFKFVGDQGAQTIGKKMEKK